MLKIVIDVEKMQQCHLIVNNAKNGRNVPHIQSLETSERLRNKSEIFQHDFLLRTIHKIRNRLKVC